MTSSTIDTPDPIAQALVQRAHAASGAYARIPNGRSVPISRSSPVVPAGRGRIIAGSPGDGDRFCRCHGSGQSTRNGQALREQYHHLSPCWGLHSPCQDQLAHLALKRLHRSYGHAQVQASPLTRDLVDRMLVAAGTGLRDQRNQALLAVAYDSMCRRSELVALQRVDLGRGQHGEGTVNIRRSKTDQEGRGQVRYLAPDTMRYVDTRLAGAGHAE